MTAKDDFDDFELEAALDEFPELYVEAPSEEHIWRDEELLKRAYKREYAGLSQDQIARLWNTTQATISDWLQRHDIKTRTRAEGRRMVEGDTPWQDEETMQMLFEDENLSPVEIAEELGCSDQTVRDWLERFNLREKTKGEPKPWHEKDRLQELLEEGYSESQIADQLGCDQATISRWVKKHGITPAWHDKNQLQDLYEEQGCTQEELAERFDLSVFQVSYWLDRYDIIDESKRVYSPNTPD